MAMLYNFRILILMNQTIIKVLGMKLTNLDDGNAIFMKGNVNKR